MSYLNLMGNKLKPKDVNDALEDINGALKDINVDGIKEDISDIKSDISSLTVTVNAIPVIEKIEVTATTNASGKITISNTDVPLNKLISVIVKAPTGYNVLVYRGSASYGCIVTEQGALTPVANTECTLEITKFK